MGAINYQQQRNSTLSTSRVGFEYPWPIDVFYMLGLLQAIHAYEQMSHSKRYIFTLLSNIDLNNAVRHTVLTISDSLFIVFTVQYGTARFLWVLKRIVILRQYLL